MKTVSRFSRQNDAGLRALTVVLWENLTLVLESKNFDNFADYRPRKHLAESLILSKLDYCDTVFYALPDFLVKRLQRV